MTLLPDRSNTPRLPTRHTKSEARIAAIEALYLQQMSDETKNAQAAIDDILYYYRTTQPSFKLHKAFLYEIVEGTLANKISLDARIVEHLMDNWRMDRLDIVIQSILRAATFELVYCQKTPFKVIINEYIDVAHCFCDSKETSFINGILDRIATSLHT